MESTHQNLSAENLLLTFEITKEPGFDWFYNITISARCAATPPTQSKPGLSLSNLKLATFDSLECSRTGKGSIGERFEEMIKTASKNDSTETPQGDAKNDNARDFEHDLEHDDEHDGDELDDESDDELDDEGDDNDDEEQNERTAVAYLQARIVRRGLIRSEFWQEMEEPSQDTSALAFGVFDRYGCLRQEFTTGSQKGSGRFGEEMDLGNMLHIESLYVDPVWRQKGVASRMLHLLLDKVGNLQEAPTFAFAWPTTLNALRATTPGDMAVVSLFSKSGFRRIGTTEWFAYVFDDHHPSRLLAINQDTPAASEISLSEADKFAAQLESTRSTRSVGMMTLIVADKFRGHSDADVEKMVTLLGPSHDSKEIRARIKFGCTCACCISGYLSRRMQYQLRAQSEILHDMMETDLEMINEDPSILNDEGIFGTTVAGMYNHLPHGVKQNMATNKSMRRGHQNLVQYIGDCLRADIAPTVRHILQAADRAAEWPPNTRNYFARGGTVEGVQEALFEYARSSDEFVGDGHFAGDMPEIRQEYNALPRCRNDGEWSFVLGMLLIV